MSPALVSGDDRMEYGVCPIMTASAVVQQPTPAGLQTPGGANVGAVTAYSPCIGGRCQWWDPGENRCAIWSIAMIVAAADRVGNMVSELDARPPLSSRKTSRE